MSSASTGNHGMAVAILAAAVSGALLWRTRRRCGGGGGSGKGQAAAPFRRDFQLDDMAQLRLDKEMQRIQARADIQRIIFLGTGSATPIPDRRNTSACAVLLSTGGVLLLDCGEATQHQIVRSTSIKMARIDAICITHLHGDHCFGLPGLICSMAMQGRLAPLRIIGPRGIRTMVRTALDIQSGGGYFGVFDLQFTELTHAEIEARWSGSGGAGSSAVNDDGTRGGSGGSIELPGQIRLRPVRLKHVPGLETFGYVIREPRRPTRVFDPSTVLKSLPKGAKISKTLMDKLRRHEDVTITYMPRVTAAKKLANDQQEQSIHVLAASCWRDNVDRKKPKTIVILQDTCDSVSSPDLHAAQDCDVLIHESTFESNLEEKAVQYGHATPAMAMRCACAVRAKMLVLTHFSARYARSEPSLFQRFEHGLLNAGGERPLKKRPTALRVGAANPDAMDALHEAEEEGRKLKFSCLMVAACDFLDIAYGTSVSSSRKRGTPNVKDKKQARAAKSGTCNSREETLQPAWRVQDHLDITVHDSFNFGSNNSPRPLAAAGHHCRRCSVCD